MEPQLAFQNEASPWSLLPPSAHRLLPSSPSPPPSDPVLQLHSLPLTAACLRLPPTYWGPQPGHHAALSQGHGGLTANANPIELQSNTKATHVRSAFLDTRNRSQSTSEEIPPSAHSSGTPSCNEHGSAIYCPSADGQPWLDGEQTISGAGDGRGSQTIGSTLVLGRLHRTTVRLCTELWGADTGLHVWDFKRSGPGPTQPALQAEAKPPSPLSPPVPPCLPPVSPCLSCSVLI
ncbi:unnamed protein product [Boreogadus saida]